MAGTQGLECYRPQTREEIQSPHSASFPFVRVRQVPDRAPVNRAAQRLGRAASIPRAKATELLAGGTRERSRRHGACRRRYHCPCPGCPLNRSRRCTRSRVPPSASLCSRSCGCHFPFALTPACAGFSPFGLPSLTEPRREWRRIGVGDRRCRRARVGRRSP